MLQVVIYVHGAWHSTTI